MKQCLMTKAIKSKNLLTIYEFSRGSREGWERRGLFTASSRRALLLGAKNSILWRKRNLETENQRRRRRTTEKNVITFTQ
jgi:hypothetical protein